MKFKTTPYKIKETKFFLQKIKESYNEEGYDVDFYLDALLSSCRSVIDFMQSDFLYDVDPKLSNNDKRVIQKFHTMKMEHTQRNEINEFLSNIWKDFIKFKNEKPIRCYFFEKRNMSIHSEPTTRGGGTFTQTPEGKPVYDNHYLESQIEVTLERTSGKEVIDLGNCSLTTSQRDDLLEQLAYEDMRPLLDSFVHDLEKFVNEMEIKYCKEDVRQTV